MALTDKLQAEKAGLESYLDSQRGAKLEQSQIDRLNTINSLLSLGDGSGDASASNQSTQITVANLTNTRVGDVAETAPASDTASSGLNGRLQRISQRLTSLIAHLPSSLGIKTAANSLSVAPASDAVFRVVQSAVSALSTATIQRAANTTPYSIGDSYGGRGVFTNVGSIGQSLFINDFQVIIDITAIPANMALSVRFFTTEADTQVTGAPVSDNSLLTATLPNTATPADGYPLTISVIGDKVFAVAKNIKFITPLEATSLWFYLRCNAAFTPAANSETMRAKASCEVY
jgi:hypothetical protein